MHIGLGLCMKGARGLGIPIWIGEEVELVISTRI